jgi:hypothetical protein
MRREPPALILSLGLAGCASPTAITVDVYTEVPCATGAEVSLTLADSLPALSSSAPSSTSAGCLDPSGHVGSIVIAPAGDEGKLVTFAVATRDDGGATEECLTSPLPDACIVARRQLRFDPRADLPVRVDLRDACRGIDCPADQTCVKGTCVSAAVPAICSGACDDGQLPPSNSGPSRLSAGGALGVHIVATDKGFAAAWPASEPDLDYAVHLQPLDGTAVPVGSVSPPIAKSATRIEDLLLGYDGTSYGIAVRTTMTSILVAGDDGTVIAGPGTLGGPVGLAAHGLPWTGTHFVLVSDGPNMGDMTIDYYDAQANEAPYDAGQNPGVVGTVAWDGSTNFAASYAWSGACGFLYRTDSAGSPGFAQYPESCAAMAIAPAAGGGWHLVYESQSSPSQVFYRTVDASGTMQAGPTQVSPGDGQSYEGAQVVPTAAGAAVFFTAAGGMTAPLYRADVASGAKLVAPAAVVPTVAVASKSYELAVSGGKIGIVWYGRPDNPGASPNGIFAAALSAGP